MGHTTPSRIQILLKVSILAATVWTGTLLCAAQTPSEEFRNFLRAQAAFTPEEFAALEQGGLVVKLLPVTDKREVAVCGLLRVQSNPALSLSAFTGSLTQQHNRVVLSGGTLGTPPAVEDLQSLTMSNRDLEEMKWCTVGGCGLKLSAAMIERLRKEVDWDAPDHRLRATGLFKQMLVEYVRDYFTRGDAALIKYHNRADAVRLDEEQRSLLDALPYLKDSAPEFAGYLRGFPGVELSGVEDSLHWSRLKFGLKPVVVITHTATYARQHGQARQILLATKQLYASHYLDSSLSLTLLTEVPVPDGVSETYLLYVNRSRADVFGGPFGGLKRRLVESAVVEGLTATLQQTRQSVRLRLLNAAPPPDDEAARPRPWAQPLFKTAGLFLVVFFIVTGVILTRLWKRDSGRTARKSGWH